MKNQLTILYEPGTEGGFTASIPEVPGVVSEGETLEEARRMVLEALEEMLSYRQEKARTKSRSGVIFETIEWSFSAE